MSHLNRTHPSLPPPGNYTGMASQQPMASGMPHVMHTRHAARRASHPYDRNDHQQTPAPVYRHRVDGTIVGTTCQSGRQPVSQQDSEYTEQDMQMLAQLGQRLEELKGRKESSRKADDCVAILAAHQRARSAKNLTHLQKLIRDEKDSDRKRSLQVEMESYIADMRAISEKVTAKGGPPFVDVDWGNSSVGGI